MCENQPVSVADIDMTKEAVHDVLDEVSFSSDLLTNEQLQQGKDLLCQFRDFFSTSDTYIGHTDAVHHRIDLFDETLFNQSHRRIPPSMLEEMRNHLQQL